MPGVRQARNGASANMSRTPEQQRAIVDRILAAWLRMPDLRFGQLVSAAADRAEHDAFYIRDEALCEAVEALANGESK